MNRREFGQLVAALRRERINLDGGAWTQAQLAEAADLPVRTIGEIERGARANLDQETLTLLAQALGLTTMEHREFYVAAVEVGAAVEVDNTDSTLVVNNTPRTVSADAILAELKEAVRTLRVPAFIHDGCFNVFAANMMMREFSLVSAEIIHSGQGAPAGYNLMRYYFAPDGPLNELFDDSAMWHTYVMRNMLQFRATSLKYRHTESFRQLRNDLWRYPRFRSFWFNALTEEQDVYRSWATVSYKHPTLGPIHYVGNRSLTLTPRGELHLVTFAPCSQKTAEKFEALAQTVSDRLFQLRDWPCAE